MEPAMKIVKTIIQEQKANRLGEKIKKARMADDRSLAQICKDCGLSRSYWYQVENNEVPRIHLETLQKIESVLGVDFGIKFDE